MLKSAYIFFAFCIFFLNGCGGGGGSSSSSMNGSTPTTTTTSISGVITLSVGGAPISGATLSLVQSPSQTATGLSATSNSSGQFTISGVSAGTYDVIATAPATSSCAAFSTSRYQSVSVGSLAVTGINIPVYCGSGVGKSGNSPVITLGNGTPGPGSAVSGTQTFSVSAAESGSNTNAINLIYIRSGGNLIAQGNAGQNSVSLSVNFSKFPPGQVPIALLAQDVANDIAILQYNVNNSGSGAIPTTSFTVKPLATTFAQDLGTFVASRKKAWGKYGFKGNPDLLKLPDGRTIPLSNLKHRKPYSTTTGLTIIVVVDIDRSSSTAPAGYNIYRSTSPTGPFTQIGSIPQGSIPASGCVDNDSSCDAEFYDFDSSLTAGTSYYYQAADYTGGGTGTLFPSSPPAVTLLNSFTVNLSSPGIGPSQMTTQGVTPVVSNGSPALQWQASSAVGTEQVYDPVILSYTNNYTNTFRCGGNTLFSGGKPIVVVKNGQLVTPVTSSGQPDTTNVVLSNAATNISFAYAAFNDTTTVTPDPCSQSLQGGVTYEWDLVESIAEGSENPVGSGNFLAVSVGNGEAFLNSESLTSGSSNGAFFFTVQP